MNVLGFARHGEVVDGRRVRRPLFEPRSSLPVSAACVVANGVRETLSALLATASSVRLLEPVIPCEQAWAAIGADAQLYGMRGPLGDAALILRTRDALALAAAAFGEPPGDGRELSALERDVVSRALAALGACLSSVCGRDAAPFERVPDVRRYVTYFEVLVERPVQLRLGVALSRDPVVRGSGRLGLDDLMDVEIELAVEFARGAIDAAEFLDVHSGVNVPLQTRIGEPALLTASGRILAQGECGTLGERNVLIVKGT